MAKAEQILTGGQFLNDNLGKVKPFLAMEILEKAQQMEKEGAHIIHMEVGEPGGETPALIKEAAIRALGDNDTNYTHSLGKPELREAIASYYQESYGVKIDPGQVIVTSGSSPAMLLSFYALLGRGDRLLMSDPYYACYPNFTYAAGAEPVFVPALEENAFRMQVNDIKKKLDPGVKGILINSPANPTGTVLGPAELEEIASIGPLVISDEVYHGINYEGRDHSILEFTDNAIVINGFSKRNIMTGWRLGYLIAPQTMIRDMQKLQQNLFICACSFIQAAGLAALQESPAVLEDRFKSYNSRRKRLYTFLQELGIAPAMPPQGAFYMLANVKKYTGDSYAFALQILKEARVALTPGIDFGPGAEGYIRISYACSDQTMEEGLSRLEKFFAGLNRVR